MLMTQRLRDLSLTVVFVSLICTIGFGAAAQPAMAQTQAAKAAGTDEVPKAVFPQTRYQFEAVMEGQELKHDFIVENRGNAPLIIKKVRPD